MKERPILFSAPMVRALLDGSKTQTRRVCKPQPFDRSYSKHDHRMAYVCGRAANGDEIDGFYAYSTSSGGKWQVKCPYGQPGDRLWVREGWKAHTTFDHLPPRHIPESHVWYLADPGYKAESRGRASLHMPRWASRILLEIVSVRVERLQDIGAEDIEAEGVVTSDEAIMEHGCRARVIDFTRLWESINGAGSWDDNSWVWVVEFKRATP